MPDSEDLFTAIRTGDAARVRAMVQADPGLAEARDESGLSAVMTAAYHHQQEVLRVLLDADPELDIFAAA
ncbi:MAG: ankyrin repeat domain-containing protein, partial [Dehalococcoidia bacterium]|nr:ankyrin repeat domain-containing protein [Dehalococcoidia bacterium]